MTHPHPLPEAANLRCRRCRAATTVAELRAESERHLRLAFAWLALAGLCAAVFASLVILAASR